MPLPKNVTSAGTCIAKLRDLFVNIVYKKNRASHMNAAVLQQQLVHFNLEMIVEDSNQPLIVKDCNSCLIK